MLTTDLDKQKLVVIGALGTPYGVKGWLHLYSATDPIENILAYSQFLAEVQQGFQARIVEKVKGHGANFVVKILGIDDRDQALLASASQIFVRRDELPPLIEGEYYWADLLGLQVINQHNCTLGIITSFCETGANDVFIVQGDKEHLIPYVPGEYVLSIDLVSKQVRVNWDVEF